MFLRNEWYVAAWDQEVGRTLVPRTILGDKVVLYRKEDGTVVALEDACPHRKLPLSMGRLIEDRVQCGYHGLEFDCTGTCVQAPTQDRIPDNADIRSYPVIERWNWIWIWMGDPARADEGKIIDIPHFDDPNWGVNRGPAMDIACNYQFMTDNLLDPSHVSFVHSSSLGNEDTISAQVETEVKGTTVITSRWLLECRLAPFFEPRVKFSGLVDRLQHYELRLPSMAVIKDIIAPAGAGAPEGRLHPNVFLLDSYNFITPVDEENCRYYWFQVRNFDPADEAVSGDLTNDFIEAFSEDKVVMEAVQIGMKDKKTPNLDLAIDKGSRRARKILQKMIMAEQQDKVTE